MATTGTIEWANTLSGPNQCGGTTGNVPVAVVPGSLFDSVNVCHKTVRITSGAVHADVPIVGSCRSCSPGQLVLSPPAFLEFGALQPRRQLPVQWEVVDPSTSTNNPTPPLTTASPTSSRTQSSTPTTPPASSSTTAQLPTSSSSLTSNPAPTLPSTSTSTSATAFLSSVPTSGSTAIPILSSAHSGPSARVIVPAVVVPVVVVLGLVIFFLFLRARARRPGTIAAYPSPSVDFDPATEKVTSEVSAYPIHSTSAPSSSVGPAAKAEVLVGKVSPPTQRLPSRAESVKEVDALHAAMQRAGVSVQGVIERLRPSGSGRGRDLGEGTLPAYDA